MSLRQGGKPLDIPAIPEKIKKYFENNQKA
jgi:hypothetical protein